jgi:hypothetical protein
MNLRTLLLSTALAASACSITVPDQFPCNTPGSTSECGSSTKICGADKLCTDLVACASTEDRCNGVCVDVTHNREHCGKCGITCAASEQCLPNANNVPTCTPFCAAGQRACAQPTGGFICKDLGSDRNNCGNCDAACSPGLVCSPPSPGAPGRCTTVCSPGLTNCSGDCINVNIDAKNCGECGAVCGGGQQCVSGHCKTVCPANLTECPSGSGNCVDTTSDRANCGGCAGSGGRVCQSGFVCNSSQCEVSCQPGLTQCGSTCVNSVADPNNCGGCGVRCGAGQACTNHGPNGAGVCELQCPAGETACPTSAPTYCANLQTDRDNCGGCNDAANSGVCPSGEVCLGGSCKLSCPAGFTECNGRCVDTSNDPANCGGCSGGTLSDGGTSSFACTGGLVCVGRTCTTSCPSGQTNCGGRCVDLSTDPQNCGACDSPSDRRACGPGKACVGGGCVVSCPPGSLDCGNGVCVDPLHDNAHCGNCATACTTPGTSCQPQGSPAAGACLPTCAANLRACLGGCKDAQNDPANCGTCGNVCPSGQSCITGVCQVQCPAGQTPCGPTCTDTSTDPQHCGGCAPAFDCRPSQAADNVVPVCAAGTCSAACLAGFAECDLDKADGCESRSASDAANCGGCAGHGGAACGGATPYCVAGACAGGLPTGVQQNLSLAAVQGDGWTQCWPPSGQTETYSTSTTSLSSIATACSGGSVLVACRAPGSPALLVAAAGPAGVLSTASTTSGGVAWYSDGTSSFGFAPAGAAVNRAPCDVAGGAADGYAAGSGSQRLCWPAQNGTLVAGARCGDREGPGATTNFERLVFKK